MRAVDSQQAREQPSGRLRTRRQVLLGGVLVAVLVLVAFPGAAWADVMASEGQEFSGSVAPSGGCGFAVATVDWGDGTTSDAGLTQDGTAFTGTHTYAEEGTYSGSVAYTCPLLSGTLHQPFQAIVQDAPLTASGRDGFGAAGRSLSAVLAHVDDANPGAGADDFSAQIAWGDGSTSAGTVAAAAGGGFDVIGTHTYDTAGSYQVSTGVSDVGGAATTASSTAQIAQTALPPPSATLTSPVDGGTYTRGQVVDAGYSCSPGAGGVLRPGVAGCSGPAPSGGPVDTSTVGAHTFVVIATDTDGQSATATSHYSVRGAAPHPHGRPGPVARARTVGISKTLKGGLWLSGTDSTTVVDRRIVDYSWAIDGGAYTPCGPSPIATMTFPRVGGHRVSLRVTDSLGSVSISDVKVNAVKSAINSQAVLDCENPAAGGNQPSTADCVKVFAWSIVEVGSRGGPGDCFKLDQFIELNRPRPFLPASDSAHPALAAPNLHDLYRFHATITGPVAINGLYVPVPSGVKSEYDSGDSTVGLGHVSLSLGPLGSQDLNLSLKVKQEKIPAGGCYSGATMGYHLPTNGLLKGDTKIAGLPIGGSLAIDLLYRSSRITAMVSLPNIFKLSNDAPAQGTVCLNADNTHGVSFEGIKISVPSAMIGPLELKDLSFTYLKDQNVLSGGATVILYPGGYGINASPPPPDQGFGLKNGKFDHAGIGLDFGRAGPVVYPGVQLNYIGVAIGVNPVRFTGEIGVLAAQVVAIRGDAFVVFASGSQPYDYPTSGGPLAPLSGKTFNTFAMAIAGEAKIVVPVLGEVALANGFLLYEAPAYLEFGGGFDAHYSFMHVRGSITGFVDPAQRAFNLEGRLDACVGTVKIKIWFIKYTINLCISYGGVVSSKGIGLCGPIPFPPLAWIKVTVGYVWGGGPRVSFFSCDFGDFEVQPTRARDLRARDAAAPGITLPSRLDAATIRVTGAGGPPDAVVTAPDGTHFSTADHTPSNDVVVMQIAGSNETLIGFRHPHPGRWSIAPAPGSVPITQIAVAKSLPNPDVVASVRRHGRRATLRYRLTSIPGRQVSFAERGPATARMIGTAKGNRGTISFTPGDGPAGRRRIVALITQNGTPVRDVVVTSYTAPGPLRVGAPTRVRAVRHGSRLRISWTPVPGAASYATTLSLSNGHREMLFSRRASVAFIGADTSLRGSVAVLALGANGTRGTLGKALIPASRAAGHRR